MTQLTGHKVNGCNDKLVITVVDEKGAGGAHHLYEIAGMDTSANPSLNEDRGYRKSFLKLPIPFQNGPIKVDDIPNGVTHEALLAILIHRLECFQAGQYACDENAEALDHLQRAQLSLHRRTARRVSQGIEGTHAKDNEAAEPLVGTTGFDVPK